MTFRYLLWDFDGTLFDTYPPLVNSIQQALAEIGQQISTDRVRALLSDTLSDTIDTLCAEFGLERETFIERIGHYQATITPADRPPFPGALAICERLNAAGGANLLFTHRDRDSLYNLLSWHGADHLFLDVLTTEDGYPRKPDPAGFVALIERHALPREQVLAVGDRDLDILAGRRAGIATCLFNAAPSPDAPPDYVIAHLDELAPLLGLNADSDRKSTRR